ncbi:MAG: DUF3592 domain-containing protein [Anaerolineae bacterium]|nr:DUF3592 domain-containing protein [Anaerolineae bacterium]
MQGTEFLIVLGSGAFLLGLALIIWISVTKRRGYGTPNWPTVAGHVLSSTAVELKRETSAGMVSTFTPIIRYEYEVEGLLHTSARLNFLSDEHRTFKERHAAGQVVAKYPIGASVDVFCNPANPKQAALDVPRPAAHNAVLAYGVTNLVAGALIIALGIVLL